MVGFPPEDDSLVTLATWQDPPNVRWAFQHMREIIPTQLIAASPVPRPLTGALDPSVGATPVTRLDRSAATADDVFADTWTDAVLVLHDGVLVEERYVDPMTPTTPHLLMSVTKSVVGCVAGILVGRGVLDPEAPISTYVPGGRGVGVRRRHGAAPARHAHRRGASARPTSSPTPRSG